MKERRDGDKGIERRDIDKRKEGRDRERGGQVMREIVRKKESGWH